MEKSLAVVAYMLAQLKESTRGKLARLLFLVDALGWKLYNRYVTELVYRKYFLGPYPPDLARLEIELYKRRLAVAVVTNHDVPNERKVFEDLWIGPTPFDVLDTSDAAVVDEILEHFGGWNFEHLREYIESSQHYQQLEYGTIVQPAMFTDLV